MKTQNILINAVLDNIKLNFEDNFETRARKEIEIYYSAYRYEISDEFDEAVNYIDEEDIREVQALLDEKFGR